MTTVQIKEINEPTMKKKLHYFISGGKTCWSFFWTVCLLAICATASAQDITLKGVVLDEETKGPVPAVNISVKGTNLRTATNSEGQYTISNLQSNAVLIFTYIGYKQQEIAVNGRTKLDVTLISDFGKLEVTVLILNQHFCQGLVSAINILSEIK